MRYPDGIVFQTAFSDYVPNELQLSSSDGFYKHSVPVGLLTGNSPVLWVVDEVHSSFLRDFISVLL